MDNVAQKDPWTLPRTQTMKIQFWNPQMREVRQQTYRNGEAKEKPSSFFFFWKTQMNKNYLNRLPHILLVWPLEHQIPLHQSSSSVQLNLCHSRIQSCYSSAETNRNTDDILDLSASFLVFTLLKAKFQTSLITGFFCWANHQLKVSHRMHFLLTKLTNIIDSQTDFDGFQGHSSKHNHYISAHDWNLILLTEKLITTITPPPRSHWIANRKKNHYGKEQDMGCPKATVNREQRQSLPATLRNI